MANPFLQIAATPAVKAAEAAHDSRHAYARLEGGPLGNDRIDPAEAAFISARDSFYMATVSETVADFRGNKQHISLGNLGGNDYAALILVDYPARRRLKLFARVDARDLAADAALAAIVATPGYKAVPERALVFRVEAFDWNCRGTSRRASPKPRSRPP